MTAAVLPVDCSCHLSRRCFASQQLPSTVFCDPRDRVYSKCRAPFKCTAHWRRRKEASRTRRLIGGNVPVGGDNVFPRKSRITHAAAFFVRRLHTTSVCRYDWNSVADVVDGRLRLWYSTTVHRLDRGEAGDCVGPNEPVLADVACSGMLGRARPLGGGGDARGICLNGGSPSVLHRAHAPPLITGQGLMN